MYESSSPFDADPYKEYTVVKIGSESGHTTGDLKHGFCSIRKLFPNIPGMYLQLEDCYKIYDRNNQPFFELGDSGAAVFVVDETNSSQRPLALAIGKQTDHEITAACPIKNILEVLNLSIVQPAQPMDIP